MNRRSLLKSLAGLIGVVWIKPKKAKVVGEEFKHASLSATWSTISGPFHVRNSVKYTDK